MTQQVYRLELTERERSDIQDLILFRFSNVPKELPGPQMVRLADIALRLRALTPVGTEGES